MNVTTQHFGGSAAYQEIFKLPFIIARIKNLITIYVLYRRLFAFKFYIHNFVIELSFLRFLIPKAFIFYF